MRPKPYEAPFRGQGLPPSRLARYPNSCVLSNQMSVSTAALHLCRLQQEHGHPPQVGWWSLIALSRLFIPNKGPVSHLRMLWGLRQRRDTQLCGHRLDTWTKQTGFVPQLPRCCDLEFAPLSTFS